MADISKINLNNNLYTIKDAEARTSIQELQTAINEKEPFIAEYNVTTYSDLNSAISNSKAIIVKNISHDTSYVTVVVNNESISGNVITLESIATDQGDLWDVTLTITSDDVWSSNFVSRDPFMLLDFTQNLNVSIPSVMTDISNTSIPNVDVSISEELGANWAIASLAKYEVFDGSNNRLNVMPICMFSMNTQKTLRLRMMAAGPNSKAARKISGAILLKHR